MSTIDLMILGVLTQKPLNAYEMNKEMEKRNIEAWMKISTTSIYKNLVRLYKAGYLDGEVVKEGEMPEKTIYTMNAKGKSYFDLLMTKFSENPGKVYTDFAAVIANLAYIEYDEGLKLISQLKDSLNEYYKMLCEFMNIKIEMKTPFIALSIVTLHEKMYRLFCEWIEEFEIEFKKMKNG